MRIGIERARETIEQADSLLITAGAGLGVDSGLPDFRGDEGFWQAYPVARRLGLSFMDLANPEWFGRDPQLAWAFYGHRLNLYRKTMPHRGFDILLALVREKQDYFLFTSNVDGQFQKAGFSPEKIYECHGSIHHLQCTECDRPIWSAEHLEVAVDMETFQALDIPRCPSCGAVARPNILMFGDWGWDGSRSAQQSYRMQHFLDPIKKSNHSMVILEIGAGEHVPTVRQMSESVAREFDALIIRINPRDYHIDPTLGIGLAMGGLEGIRFLLGDI